MKTSNPLILLLNRLRGMLAIGADRASDEPSLPAPRTEIEGKEKGGQPQ